jgi:hypothetical protein
VPRRYVKNGVTVSTRSLLGGENPQQAEGFPKEPRK